MNWIELNIIIFSMLNEIVPMLSKSIFNAYGSTTSRNGAIIAALGRHYPDPAGHWAHPDGFCVPLGKAIVEEGPFVREYNE